MNLLSMEIVYSSLLPLLIGSISTAVALVFVEKWKANRRVKDRIILLEEEHKNLKELLEKTIDSTENLRNNVQILSNQITKNSTLIDSGSEQIKVLLHPVSEIK